MSNTPNNHFQFNTRIAELVETRREEIGMSTTDLIRKFGYANLGKGHRKFNDFLAGKIAHHLILNNLAKALFLDPEKISTALDQTRRNRIEAARLKTERNEAEWRDAFKVHGVIETEKRIPRPIFVAVFAGSVKLKIVELDTSKDAQSYIQQVIDEIPNRVSENGEVLAFGKPIGATINLSPNYAIRYDLEGNRLIELDTTIRLGEAHLGIK